MPARPMFTIPLTIRLHPADDVVIARTQLVGGTVLADEGVTVAGLIPAGHKVAAHALAEGDPVRRYNQVIGFARRPIGAGEHVHLHNLAMGEFEREHRFGADAHPTDYVDPVATFMGIVRRDGPAAGRIATRNYLGILSTVNCSATVARGIAAHFDAARLAPYPNVDGVVALTHGTGCGMDVAGAGMRMLRRTLAGYARHANFGGVVFVGLGCEANQASALLGEAGLREGPLLANFSIQDAGGTSKAIERGIRLVEDMLPHANAVLGAAADLLVRHGGTAILSETPEIYGAEHLLTRRAVSAEVAQKLLARLRWWEEYTARERGEMNNNPSP